MSRKCRVIVRSAVMPGAVQPSGGLFSCRAQDATSEGGRVGGASDQDFRDWAGGCRGGLRRTAYLLSGDWFLADDLVQDTLVRIYRVWQRLERSGDVGGYARRVLLNLYLDHRRRPWRRERPTDQLPDR